MVSAHAAAPATSQGIAGPDMSLAILLAVMGEAGGESSGAESRRCNAVLVRTRANAASQGGPFAEAFSAAAQPIATARQNRPSHPRSDVSLL